MSPIPTLLSDKARPPLSRTPVGRRQQWRLCAVTDDQATPRSVYSVDGAVKKILVIILIPATGAAAQRHLLALPYPA